MPYPYQPLDHEKHEVRLLSFIRIAQSDDAATHKLTLRHVAFDDEQDPSRRPEWRKGGYSFGDTAQTSGWGDYAALSYVWGDPSDPRTVSLDGHDVSVTQNLFDVLSRLRRLMIEDVGLPRFFWIDALCIDQSNVDEKNLQVPRMRYLYGLAPVVYCFLAPITLPSSTSDDAEEELVPIETVLKLGIRTLWQLASIREHGRQPQFIEALIHGETSLEPNVMATLLLLFSNPYWTRMWIVQEMALGHSSLKLIAGDEVIPWANMALAAEVFASITELLPNVLTRVTDDIPSLKDHSPNIRAIAFAISHLFQSPDTLYTSPDWHVTMAVSTNASDPLDKVYGLLSLLDPDQASMIKVDYNKDARQVYTDFARSCVQYCGNLRVLPRASWQDPHGMWPSWVPHLTHSQLVSVGSPSSTRLRCRPLQGLAKFLAPVTRNSTLVLTGILLDHVDGLSAVGGIRSPSVLMHHSTDANNVPPEADKVSDLDYRAESALHLALIDVLCSDAQEAEPWQPTAFSMGSLRFNSTKSQAALEVCVFLYEQAKDFMLPGNMTLKQWMHYRTDSGTNQTVPLSVGQQSTLKAIARTITGRRLTVTRQGRIGIAPADARRGDAICALAGLDTLGLMRQQGDRWRWVGDCYVNGIMHGEAAVGRENDVHQFLVV